MRNVLPALLIAAATLTGCADSNLGTFNAGPLAATFSATSDKPAQTVAQCLATELDEDARVEREGDVFEVSVPRGLGTLRYRVTQRIDTDGSLVEYDSEMGTGGELDRSQVCL
ncbi:hypothetical protein [uncultured Erythrobacter sp.]|uniref:hypothetical protein n=1 Tax=uncultured Erythrobacter sp. TaxID=263913 RepID=UPI00261B3E36|nr:hypothetical protein [uncultured Erythrobacter sp.]